MNIRVRFAPSPTGNLHLGTARAALFNWLFAKRHGGTLILRIEDTDLNRSEPAYETSILQGLDWLGITLDEGPVQGGNYGPYRQSERMAAGIYRTVAQQLIEDGHAYYCFCNAEELEHERTQAESENRPYIYSQKCVHLSTETIQEKRSSGMPYTIRFKIPKSAGIIQFDDIIRGRLEFDSQLLGDFVIIKSDQSPSYNFAVVVDDIQMAITHVIRGEDHISNTPRQILVYKALGALLPQFAHLPMILGPDRSKLSKRHGATNVIDYKGAGYLGTAMVNYLALLGWSPPDETEIRTIHDISQLFDLSRVNKSGAIFDLTKLRWMNGQYIRQLSLLDLKTLVIPVLTPNIAAGFLALSDDAQMQMLHLVHDNFELLPQINDVLAVFFLSPSDYMNKCRELLFSDEERHVVQVFLQLVRTAHVFDDATVTTLLEETKTQTGLGTGKVFKPIRKICTGEQSGPHISTVLSLIGKSVIEQRLQQFLSA